MDVPLSPAISIAARRAAGNWLYKAASLVLYREREKRARAFCSTEASMHATRKGARILTGRSRAVAAGAVRALESLLSAELRLSCP
jgi:hypothetical protein